MWWKILIGFLLALIFIIIFLRATKICEGGKIMQGCGRLLFPWTKKIKLADFGSYCCVDCFKRDLDLFSAKGSSESKLVFTEKEELDGIDTGSDEGEE